MQRNNRIQGTKIEQLEQIKYFQHYHFLNPLLHQVVLFLNKLLGVCRKFISATKMQKETSNRNCNCPKKSDPNRPFTITADFSIDFFREKLQHFKKVDLKNLLRMLHLTPKQLIFKNLQHSTQIGQTFRFPYMSKRKQYLPMSLSIQSNLETVDEKSCVQGYKLIKKLNDLLILKSQK